MCVCVCACARARASIYAEHVCSMCASMQCEHGLTSTNSALPEPIRTCWGWSMGRYVASFLKAYKG